jgi:hypothetical protein
MKTALTQQYRKIWALSKMEKQSIEIYKHATVTYMKGVHKKTELLL